MSGFIGIVSRNNLHLTMKAVRSSLVQDIPCSVCVLDNGSSDGTQQWLKTVSAPDGFFYCSASAAPHSSLSACWNFLLRFAFRTGHGHALILNNDVEIRPDTYRLLLGHGGPFVTCVSVNSPEQMTGTLPTGDRPHPDFSCYLIRRQSVDRVGYFDESYYPAYCEDNDYHVRMHRAGIRAVCIDLPFLHHGAATIKSADAGERAMVSRMAQSNRRKFKDSYGCFPGTPEYEKLFV